MLWFGWRGMGSSGLISSRTAKLLILGSFGILNLKILTSSCCYSRLELIWGVVETGSAAIPSIRQFCWSWMQYFLWYYQYSEFKNCTQVVVAFNGVPPFGLLVANSKRNLTRFLSPTLFACWCFFLFSSAILLRRLALHSRPDLTIDVKRWHALVLACLQGLKVCWLVILLAIADASICPIETIRKNFAFLFN